MPSEGVVTGAQHLHFPTGISQPPIPSVHTGGIQSFVRPLSAIRHEPHADRGLRVLNRSRIGFKGRMSSAAPTHQCRKKGTPHHYVLGRAHS